MTKLLRDTAWRSLQGLFKALPANAVIEISHSGRPTRGTVLGVKIDIAQAAKPTIAKAKSPDVAAKAPETGPATAKRSEDGSDNENVQGQHGPRVASGGKRGGGKTGKGPAGR